MMMKNYFIILLMAVSALATGQYPKLWQAEAQLGENFQLTTFFDLKETGDNFQFTSPKDGDKRILGGFKASAGRTMGKLPKGGSLLTMDCQMKGDSIVGKADIVGIGTWNFKGILTSNKLNGKLFTEERIEIGDLTAVPTQQTRLDFNSLYPKILSITEDHIYSKELLKSKPWKKFKKKLKKLCKDAQDDIELFIGFSMLAQDLPFSHYNIFMQTKSDNEEEHEFTKSVEFEELNSETAYLKIKNFSTSQKELSEIMPEIVGNPAYKNLIVDLRDNGGGSLEAAYEFANHIVKSKVDVGYFPTNRLNYTQFDSDLFETLPVSKAMTLEEFSKELNSGKGVKMVFDGTGKNVFEGKIYILTNKNTASTCEPIVYLMKNKELATIIGENTAGAMLSAAPMDLEGKYKLFMPVADFFTYDGVRLDQVGVKPDVETTSEKALGKVKELTGF